jgi:hypothetical protein
MGLLQRDIHFGGDHEALDATIDVGAIVVMSNGGGIFVIHVIHGKGDGLVVAIVTKVISFNVVMGSPSPSCNVSIGPFFIDRKKVINTSIVGITSLDQQNKLVELSILGVGDLIL